MIDREVVDIALIVAAVGLIALGRNNSRSVTMRDNNHAVINQNNVYSGASPSDQKPARGWVEWLGFAFGAVGFADIALKLIGGG
jgi:hypothetical protein